MGSMGNSETNAGYNFTKAFAQNVK